MIRTARKWIAHRQRVRKEDLQGNILCGYGNHFPFGLFLFVELTDPGAGRRWLRELIPQVTPATSWQEGQRPATTLNIAFTCVGLEQLGVPDNVLRTFPKEFRDGMSAHVGELGDPDLSEWEAPLRYPQVVVMVMAQKEPFRSGQEGALRELTEEFGLKVTHVQHAELIGDPKDASQPAREHFGFADGFSQPAIPRDAGPTTRKGMGTPRGWGGWSNVAPGEFVLGYRGEDGLVPPAPAAPLGHSGSFMVLRKLYQNVPGFRAYLRAVAERPVDFLPGPPPEPGDPDYDATLAARQHAVAARLVGRWFDGRSLVKFPGPLAPESRHGLKADEVNGFRYRGFLWRRFDPDGFTCPVGAHVRRANPRDALGWNGLLAKRHRIIRRGMPYGARAFDPLVQRDYAPGGRLDPDVKDAERGLVFVCYQASIARQFEFIQKHWLNDGDAFWLGGEREPLATHEGFTVQSPDSPAYLPPPQEPLVKTLGGGYFFAPGLPALRALASAYWR